MTHARNISSEVQDRLQQRQATIPPEAFHAMTAAICHLRADAYIKRIHSAQIGSPPLQYAPLMLGLADEAKSAGMSPENENKRITFILESDVPLILMKQALEANISRAPNEPQPLRTAALIKIYNALHATIEMQEALLDSPDMDDIRSILEERRARHLSLQPSRGGPSR